jgi:AbrB family looped-hinge helix DNA binding protein
MKLGYDPKHNVAYIRFHEKPGQVTTIKISDDANVDIAPDGTVYGVELLNANEQLAGDHGALIVEAAGRVVVPKALRERLGLAGGRALEIREREGRLEIEPAPMALVRRRGARVAVPARRLPTLTDDIVRDTLEKTRR